MRKIPNLFTRSYAKFAPFGSRTFLSFRWGKKGDESCKNETCGKKLKPLFFEMFGKEAEMPPELQKLCDMKKAGIMQQPLPKVDYMGGTQYKTCGSAILLQEEKNLPEPDPPIWNKEQRSLEKMEAHPSLKEELGDPLPPFTSVEQRLIDLSDRKLHPLYMKIQSIPKRKVPVCEPSHAFVTSRSPVVPKQIHIDRNLLEKKNILVDLKRIEPPKEIIQFGVEQTLRHLAQLKEISMDKAIPVPLKCERHGKVDEHSQAAVNICKHMT